MDDFMKSKTLGTTLLIALMTSGCQSTGGLSYPALKHEVFEDPPANIEIQAEIGQPIITRIDGLAWPALKVTEPVSFSFEENKYSLKPGLYRVEGVAPSHSQVNIRDRVVSDSVDVVSSKVALILRNGKCELIPLMIQASSRNDVANPIQDNIKGLLTGERAIFGSPTPTGVSASTIGQPISQKNCFPVYDFNPNQSGSSKQELVYLGQSGDTLRFKYREYFDNLARPAFSNDLTYDISEDNVIGFRGARIEVVNASNTELTYLIQRHMED
jgi:hypothetical protein